MNLSYWLGVVLWCTVFIYAPGWLSVALVTISLVATFSEVTNEK